MKTFLDYLRKMSPRLFLSVLKRNRDYGNYNIVKLGKVTPERNIPDDIAKPIYYYKCVPLNTILGDAEIKFADQIEGMRKSCKLAANILKDCEKLIGVGITTDEIDSYAHDKIISARAYPSPLRYASFPKSICTSVNNVAAHGIPDDRKLMNGDIINVDVTVFFDGYHGDCSKTYLVGDVDDNARKLVEATEECLNKSIALCGPNVPFKNIGNFISSFASQKNLRVIPIFIGHGIGSYFHGPPEILHCRNNVPGRMQPGMTFTIEPILTLGNESVHILEDKWTAVTDDNSRSAQFEHTILITKDGAEILTQPD